MNPPVVKFLGIDPGENTGLCLESTEGRYEFKTRTWEGLVPFLFSTIPFGVELVVVEAFNLLPHKTGPKTFSSFPEVEVIGLVRGLCRNYGVEFIALSPGLYKPFAEKNIKVPADYGRVDRHQRDAYRVLKYALRFNRGIRPTSH